MQRLRGQSFSRCSQWATGSPDIPDKSTGRAGDYTNVPNKIPSKLSRLPHQGTNAAGCASSAGLPDKGTEKIPHDADCTNTAGGSARLPDKGTQKQIPHNADSTSKAGSSASLPDQGTEKQISYDADCTNRAGCAFSDGLSDKGTELPDTADFPHNIRPHRCTGWVVASSSNCTCCSGNDGSNHVVNPSGS